MELHKGQQAVVDRAAKVNVVWAGRRWGKTELLRYLTDEAVRGGKEVIVLAPSYRMIPAALPAIVRVARVGCLCSLSAGRIIVDEAEMVSDLWPLFRDEMRASVLDQRGDIWLLGTSLEDDKQKGDVAFRMLYLMAQLERGWRGTKCPTLQNPTVLVSDLDGIRAEMDDMMFQREFLEV